MENINRNYNVVLRTAFDVNRYKSNKVSPVSSNEERTLEYILGLSSVLQIYPRLFEQECFLVDNTVNDINDIPLSFRKILPKSVKILATATNKFGKWNKGAGDVETYKYLLKKKFLEDLPILHLELRLQFLSDNFFSNFDENPRSLITISKNRSSVLSGYFGMTYRDLLAFFSAQSAFLMTIRRISIEDQLLEFANANEWDFVEETCCAIRLNPLSGPECY